LIAFDDQTSTFIIPSGAGFEVVFCPGARSTNILATESDKMLQLAQNGKVSKTNQSQSKTMKRANKATFFENGAGKGVGVHGVVLLLAFVLFGFVVLG
jgi:beta-mannosidase